MDAEMLWKKMMAVPVGVFSMGAQPVLRCIVIPITAAARTRCPIQLLEGVSTSSMVSKPQPMVGQRRKLVSLRNDCPSEEGENGSTDYI